MSAVKTASNVQHSRRSFFRGRRQAASPARPPWSLSEDQFVDQCERCDKCIKACEESILVRGDGGFPEINFSLGECTFCEACVNQCPSDALNKAQVETPFSHTLSITDDCFSKKGIVCQTCKDECETRAIKLVWHSAIPVPEIDQDACTGCGACISVCPNSSISLKTE